MRLRSSQFVFFVLLACSVQIGEAYALRLVSGQTLQAAPIRSMSAASPILAPRANFGVDRPGLPLDLSQSATAAQRTPWSMPHPASASAAVASFTGLLRA